MSASAPLTRYLASLHADHFADVLRRRPDVLVAPWPAHISGATARLDSVNSIVAALRRQPLPHLEALGAITLQHMLEQTPSIENIATWLDTDAATLAPILADLAATALAWPDGSGALVTVREFPPVSAPLGEPIRDHIESMTIAQLQPLLKVLGCRVDGRKQDLADRVIAYFRDADAVRALVESAPADERDLLDEIAETGAAVNYFRDLFDRRYGARRDRTPRPGDWAVARGLLVSDNYRGTAVMPLEVTLALRGEQWRLPFHPAKPEPATTPVESDHVGTEATARLLRMIERISALADRADGELIPLLKSGTVGVRTVRAFAKEWDADTGEVTLALYLAVDIGVLQHAEPPEPARGRGRKNPPPTTSPGLGVGPSAAAWRAASTPARGATLLRQWWTSNDSPLAERTLVAELEASVFEHLRRDLVRTYCELPAESATTLDDITATVRWRSPAFDAALLTDLIGPALREAELLGVIALGAPSPLAETLLAGTLLAGTPLADDLDAAVSALVADAHTTAVFGADLTAVVFGPPATDLSRLLDSVADRESRGTATTWRFSAASIRSALDRGASAAEIRDRLTEIAQTGMPQALDYLIADVARTHGTIGVVELGCAVVTDDPVLLIELCRSRAGTKIGLAQLAPTVLTSRADAATTLEVLRGAGYAPMLRGGDGAVHLERRAVSGSSAVSDSSAVSGSSAVSDSRAESDTDGTGGSMLGAEPGRVPDADPAWLAGHLLGTIGTKPVGESASYHAFYRALAGRGDFGAIAALATGAPVSITVGDRTGLFHSAVLRENTIIAWNVGTEQYEELLGADITRVAS
ncbi:MAG: helicase-associated domain-containing protein [Rhodococcus sp. (in: high G+C Gram-positive bacteria)]|uniref:helicase-associated domain-containing protein n=1 Tax=Rhodococcus sp. TaxID=1831 RepID=UPI003BB6C8F1